MAIARNLPIPDVPFTQEFLWREFFNYLAYKFNNGLLVPEFATAPATEEYRMYFNTTTNTMEYWNGTAWVAF